VARTKFEGTFRVAGSSNDFLSGVLGADAYGAPSAPPAASTAKGATPGATQQLQDEVKRAQDEERQKREHGDSGSSSHFSVIPLSGTAMPGGYKFDTETMAAKIREFEDLKFQIDQKWQQLQGAARNATPPSFDPPAAAQAAATRDSILQAAEHNMAMSKYAQSLLDGLQKANGTYVSHDEGTAAVFKRDSSSGELPPGTGTLFEKRDSK
jgi:hypothetical protein